MSETLTDDVSGLMLAPLVGVEPTKPSAAATDTRLTLNMAAKRVDSSAIIGTTNVYRIWLEYTKAEEQTEKILILLIILNTEHYSSEAYRRSQEFVLREGTVLDLKNFSWESTWGAICTNGGAPLPNGEGSGP